MIYALLVVVVLLLSAAGVLASKNSKLISGKNAVDPAIRSTSLRYSVYDYLATEVSGGLQAVPLFQLTASKEGNATTAGDDSVKTLILCRVLEGKGEMVLADAQNWMLSHIRQAAGRGVLLQYEAYKDKSRGTGEMELILELEDALHHT